MTRHILPVLLLCLPAAAATAGSGRHGMSVTTHDGFPSRCTDLDITIEGRPALRDDDGRRVELGGGRPAVRLSTVNGPVTVASSDSDED